jgi:hypothetical protein
MAFFPHHASITPPDMGVSHAILRGSMEGAGYRGMSTLLRTLLYPCPDDTMPSVVESPPSLTTPGLVVSPFGQAHFLPGPLLLDHQLEGHQISSGKPALGRAPAYPLYEAQNEFLRRFLNFRHPWRCPEGRKSILGPMEAFLGPAEEGIGAMPSGPRRPRAA